MLEYEESKKYFLAQILFCMMLAGLTTLSLILLMHKLIFQEMSPPIDEPPIVIPKVTIERTPVEPKFEPLIVKPIEVDEAPAVPKSVESKGSEVEITIPAAVIKINDGALALNPNVGNFPVPHLLSAPKYPMRALTRGIEGWVDVRYDISAQGATENVHVISASPENIFNSSAVAAVRRWRYQPRINSSGEPIPFYGLKKRVVFQLEK